MKRAIGILITLALAWSVGAADLAPPALVAELLGNAELRLAWSLDYPTFLLESSTSLGVSGWLAVSETPVMEAGSLVVTLPMAGQARYFRLRDAGLTTVSGSSPAEEENGGQLIINP